MVRHMRNRDLQRGATRPTRRGPSSGVVGPAVLSLLLGLLAIGGGVAPAADAGPAARAGEAGIQEPVPPRGGEDGETGSGRQAEGEDGEAGSRRQGEGEERTLRPRMIGGRSVDVRQDEPISDLFAWASRVAVEARIADNAFVAARSFVLPPTGEIAGDLFVFAKSARIEGRVGGDVYLWCGIFEVSPDAVVAGNVYGGAGQSIIDGTVGGTVHGGAGYLRLDGTVRDDVTVEVGEMRIGPDARIEGDLFYESSHEAKIEDTARIAGRVKRREETEDRERGGFSWWWIGVKGLWFVGSFLVGGGLLWWRGSQARLPSVQLARHPARGLGLGFVVAVVTPVVAALGLLLGIVPGVFGFMVYLAAVYLARLVTALCVGEWLLGRLGSGGPSSTIGGLVLGLLLLYLVMLVPYVGFLAWLAAVVAGLGGLFLALKEGGEPARGGGSGAGDRVAPAA